MKTRWTFRESDKMSLRTRPERAAYDDDCVSDDEDEVRLALALSLWDCRCLQLQERTDK